MSIFKKLIYKVSIVSITLSIVTMAETQEEKFLRQMGANYHGANWHRNRDIAIMVKTLPSMWSICELEPDCFVLKLKHSTKPMVVSCSWCSLALRSPYYAIEVLPIRNGKWDTEPSSVTNLEDFYSFLLSLED